MQAKCCYPHSEVMNTENKSDRSKKLYLAASAAGGKKVGRSLQRFSCCLFSAFAYVIAPRTWLLGALYRPALSSLSLPTMPPRVFCSCFDFLSVTAICRLMEFNGVANLCFLHERGAPPRRQPAIQTRIQVPNSYLSNGQHSQDRACFRNSVLLIRAQSVLSPCAILPYFWRFPPRFWSVIWARRT